MIYIYKIFSTWYWSNPKALLLSTAVVGLLGSTEQVCRTRCSSPYRATCREIGVWEFSKKFILNKHAWCCCAQFSYGYPCMLYFSQIFGLSMWELLLKAVSPVTRFNMYHSMMLLWDLVDSIKLLGHEYRQSEFVCNLYLVGRHVLLSLASFCFFSMVLYIIFILRSSAFISKSLLKEHIIHRDNGTMIA